MKVIGVATGIVTAAATVGAVWGWVRAHDAETRLAQLNEVHRQAAARLFALDCEAARQATAGAALPALGPEQAALAMEAGWSPGEALAVARVIADLQRDASAVGVAVSPPDGAAWQLLLARSARASAVHPDAEPAQQLAAEMVLRMLRPTPSRPIREVLLAHLPGSDTTVLVALRSLRARVRSSLRVALPRQPAEQSDRFADTLLFGVPPMGLTGDELDGLLRDSSVR